MERLNNEQRAASNKGQNTNKKLTFAGGEGPHAVVGVVGDLLVAEDVDEQEVVVLLAGIVVRDGEGDMTEGSGLGHFGCLVCLGKGAALGVCKGKGGREEEEGMRNNCWCALEPLNTRFFGH